MDLQVFWFVLIGVLLAGYAFLDGFDLGVGIVFYAARTDKERRLFMNSIGPIWDGNEVWLVTFGGALFAAFPDVYATSFSAFYLPFMLLLVCLIFRAVSMEFRSKVTSPSWRRAWDFAFFASCAAASFLFGVAVGNSMVGLPIGADQEYRGHVGHLLTFYPILVGCLVVALFALHGSVYLFLKTEGDLQSRLRPLMWKCFGVFLVLYLMATIVTLVTIPHAVAPFRQLGPAWLAVLVSILALGNIPRSLYLNRPGEAFLSSGATILSLTALFGAALYPNMLVSSLDPAYNLTIYNSCSSQETLKLMRTIAFLGLPFVLSYSAAVYWVFRGKVKLDDLSY
jgi:cytochrome d ubiquinol oxidase subunit II